jgi:CheY-like chemotaxis protein
MINIFLNIREGETTCLEKKFLIIDDEADVREVLKFYLSKQNYQTIEAENG